MLSSDDLKKGRRIEVEGQPFAVESVVVQSTSARGAQTLYKVRLRHVLTRQISDRVFKAGDKFVEPDLRKRAAQYLYSAPEADGPRYYFMDTETFEQFELTEVELGDDGRILLENLELKAIEYNGQMVGVELPAYIEMTITEVEPGARGDTASGSVTTRAVTQNGLELQVPLFVKVGDRVRVDTATQAFKDRLGR